MPVLSEFRCCVSAWARLLVGFYGQRVPEGTTFECARCTRVWERAQPADGSRGRDARWMLIDEPEPESSDAQERLARDLDLLSMYANREEGGERRREREVLRLNGGEP
jgi:hypothetical protein